jgi:hypothetical protein
MSACDQQAQVSCCGDQPQLTSKVSSFDETHQWFLDLRAKGREFF